MLTASLPRHLTTSVIRQLAAECGFDLLGVTPAGPPPDFERYRSWTQRGLAGEMRYLTDHRGDLRAQPASLLEGARSVICTGLSYHGPEPCSDEFTAPELGWIARYAWGEDYHRTIKAKLETLAAKMLQIEPFSWRACVDTAPLLERSLARDAGLGWIGRNTCLINQQVGSFVLLGELLTTLDLSPDEPPPDRCGTCTRCIQACPTQALVLSPSGGYELDSRLCISYFTIELRGAIPESLRSPMGNNVFGCDICQDVCPWNSRTPRIPEPARKYEPISPAPLDRLAQISPAEFREIFRHTAVSRAKYAAFIRNVAIAMGNTRSERFRAPLQKLATSDDPLIAEHARWALSQIHSSAETPRSPDTP